MTGKKSIESRIAIRIGHCYQSWSRFMLAVFFVLVGLSRIAIGQQSALSILVPKGNNTIMSIGAASITGRFDPKRINSVQLVKRFEVRKMFRTAAVKDPEEFKKGILSITARGVILDSAIVKYRQSDGEENTLRYSLQNYPLESLPSSQIFQEITEEVCNENTLSAQVILRGNMLTTLAVDDSLYRKRCDKFFSFSVPLAPKLNVFFIRGLVKDKQKVEEDTVLIYHTTEAQTSGFPDQVVHKAFHTDEEERDCNQCHTLSGRNVAGIDCNTCHKRLIDSSLSKCKSAQWACVTCHDSSSNPKYQLYIKKTYKASLCFPCHAAIKERLNALPVVHAPAGAGECLTCHDAHGIHTHKLAGGNINDQCVQCHEGAEEYPHPVVGHPTRDRLDPSHEGKELSCASCHNPHAAENVYLLGVPKFKLCLTCHSK